MNAIEIIIYTALVIVALFILQGIFERKIMARINKLKDTCNSMIRDMNQIHLNFINLVKDMEVLEACVVLSESEKNNDA